MAMIVMLMVMLMLAIMIMKILTIETMFKDKSKYGDFALMAQ